MDNTFSLAQSLEEAFNQFGASMMSDAFAGKLLAWAMVTNDEVMVYNEALKAGIAIAAQKYNIKGGEIPKAKAIPVIRAYAKDLERRGNKTPWLKEIYDRYGIKYKTR